MNRRVLGMRLPWPIEDKENMPGGAKELGSVSPAQTENKISLVLILETKELNCNRVFQF
jgi:hypothetical protein